MNTLIVMSPTFVIYVAAKEHSSLVIDRFTRLWKEKHPDVGIVFINGPTLAIDMRPKP